MIVSQDEEILTLGVRVGPGRRSKEHELMTTKRLLILVAAASVYVSVGPVCAAGYSPRVGIPHADFTLPSINGGKGVSLADFRGKKVLLLHFASW